MHSSLKCVSLLLAAFSVQCQLQVLDLANTDEYFGPLHRSHHALRGFYDPDSKPNTSEVLIRLFDDLAKNEFLIENQFNLGLVNLAKVPFFKRHYDIINQSHFLYFIKNQMQGLENFNELTIEAAENPESYDKLLASVLEFIHAKYSRVSVELTSIEQFEQVLKRYKVIGVFFASEERELNVYKSFAATHVDFNFYYVKDQQLAHSIFFSRSTDERPSGSFFAIFRSAEALDQFDDKPVVFTVSVANEKMLEAFFRPQRNSKMIKESDADSIPFRIYSLGERLVLYAWDGHNRSGLDLFENTVRILPKHFIFSSISTESDYLGAFIQYFIVGHSSITPNNVYIIYLGANGTLDIKTMNGELTQQNIVSFVYNFYKNSPPDWEVAAQKSVNSPADDQVNNAESISSEEL
jgi:hypothetical protein